MLLSFGLGSYIAGNFIAEIWILVDELKSLKSKFLGLEISKIEWG